MKVLIFGCGPAGLLAAEAVKMSGHEAVILSQSYQPSPIGGAQYLHEHIEGVTSSEPDGLVHFHKVGTGQGYAKKVYGNKLAPTSWSIFPEGEFPCWNLASLYSRLHKDWMDSVSIVHINKVWLDAFEEEFANQFDLTISTIPASVLCTNPEHTFPAVKVAFEATKYADRNLGDNFIYYSGDPNDPWYRWSNIFGQGWKEYALNDVPQDRPRVVFEGVKPLNTDCDCRPRIVRAGRFGEWKKGRLVHHAYFKTLDALEIVNALH
jgi:hypothetical protein